MKMKSKSKMKSQKKDKLFAGIDLFWNGPNVVLMAKIKYLLFSHLTAMVPIQTTPLAEFERDLIQLSFHIRKYCSHQYTLHSVLHNMLDESIDSFRTTKFHDSLMREIANANAYLLHGGGKSLSSFCKTLVLILFCQMSLSQPNESVDKKMVTSHVYPLRRERDNVVDNLDDMLDNMSYVETKPVKVSKIIHNKRNTMLDYMQSLLVSTDTMTDIVSHFNEKAGMFSDEYSNICKQLMDETYENHIFKDWKADEELQELNAKIDEIAKTEDAESIQRIAASVSASAVSFATGDIINGATFLGNAFFGKNTDKTSNLKSTTKKNEKLKDTDLMQVSKRFCTNSFQLFLNWEEDTNGLKLVADKINYDGLLHFIEQIKTNIEVYEKIESNQEESTKKQLESIRQRFAVMQKIVFYMKELVHNDFHTTVKTIDNRSGTFADIQKFFSRQSHELHSFLELSRLQFPMDSLKLERQGKQWVEEQMAKQKHAFLEDMKRQGVAQEIADSMQSQWIAANTIMQSATDITTAFIKMSGKTIASGAFALPEGVLESFIDKLEDILRYSLLKPGVFCTLLCMFFFFLAVCLGNPVVWAGKKILKIGFQGVTLVYKLVKTPFGYFVQVESTVVEKHNKTVKRLA
jgi:hypothetical protein